MLANIGNSGKRSNNSMDQGHIFINILYFFPVLSGNKKINIKSNFPSWIPD